MTRKAAKNLTELIFSVLKSDKTDTTTVTRSNRFLHPVKTRQWAIKLGAVHFFQ